jgi:simple sugar transport system permease protein
MSDLEPTPAETEVEAPPAAEPGEYAPSVAARFAVAERAGGFVTPLVTAIFAFLVGGLVVLATGKNPLRVYSAIFNGTGLKWLYYAVAGVHGANRAIEASYLQLTLIYMTTLILTGLAVAFAFRCGLFNIGGQGQYIVGSLVAVQTGIWFGSVPKPLHILIAMVFATVAGALWAGIAGLLRATVGAHEVITTIMLNWIALYGGSYLVGFGGRCRTRASAG